MSQAPKGMFTKAALERLSSPERLDQLMRFGSTRLWLELGAMVAVLCAVVAWGLLAWVGTQVSGTGVILRPGGVETAVSMGAGQVERLLVKAGDRVEAGQAVATILQPERADALHAAELEVQGLELQRDRLAGLRTGQDKLQDESFARRRTALESQIGDLAKDAERLRAQADSERRLLAGGLITRNQLAETERSLAADETGMAARRGELSTLGSEQFRDTHANTGDRLVLDRQLADAKARVESLRRSLATESVVRSTGTGMVTEVSVRVGDVLHAGEAVLRLQRQETALHVALYVPAEKAKQIRAGMPAELSPAGLKREEYGFLAGEVERVSEFPVSPDRLMTVLANESMAHALEAGGAVSEVEVALPVDAAGRYRWSSVRGQNVVLSAGTMVAGDVTVRREHPMALVVPYARKELGLR